MNKFNNIFHIRKDVLARLLLLPKPDFSRFLIIRKKEIAFGLLCAGMLIAYLSSLNPWFMWQFSNIYPVVAAMLLLTALLLSQNTSTSLFTRRDYFIPLICYVIFTVTIAMIKDRNIFHYILIVFNSIIMLSLFRLDRNSLQNLSTFLAKAMACLMCVSIPFYILFLLGFHLPHYHIVNEELMYSYENYRFFLLDDRSVFILIPRFHSVFLEPGHLGTACTFLMLTQIGKWKKWYNIVLFVTTIITFSLAAYVLLVMAYFSSVWLKRKSIARKILILISFLAAVTLISIFYNKGQNLVNQLIVQRLTINSDGKLEGDNRVTDLFQREYDKFLKSDDILIGKEYQLGKFGWGNAGFRVFIYSNGLIGLFLFIVFYIAMIYHSDDKRGKIVMLIIVFASFIVRATPIAYYYILPMYMLAYIGTPISVLQKQKTHTTPTIQHE